MFIGIDTSNYTSSMALVYSDGRVAKDVRIPLKVEKGQKGLRQSEAVFQHIRNLENMACEIRGLTSENIMAVSASSSPRSVEGSYMPVFAVSKNIGLLLSSILDTPFYETTHQLGHLKNGMEFTNIDKNKPFIAVHFSGGTNEILLVKTHENKIYEKIIGYTLDITAGQLIDRIGVYTGLPFPCGPAMDSLAKNDLSWHILSKCYFKEGNISFSGFETYIKRLIDENKYPLGAIYYSVFYNIGLSLEKMIRYHCNSCNIDQVLLFGGVLANSVIKNLLTENFTGSSVKLFFCDEKYTGDNAVGVALIARDYYGESI